jgi:hypothetical protein
MPVMGESRFAAMSADGRMVAFCSDASRLVRGDTNRKVDVFVRDRVAGTTRRVSVSSAERQGNRSSCGINGIWMGQSLYHPVSISASGRFVAFMSRATNLVPRDTNRVSDVFVRDLQSGTTRRVSISNHGHQANRGSGEPVITASSGSVAFTSYATNLTARDRNDSSDIFVRNLSLGATSRVSVSSHEAQANDFSQYADMSTHGRYVVFISQASNLVRNDTMGGADVFVRDRARGTTRLVSVSSNGEQMNAGAFYTAISSTGRYVLFSSDADNLVRGDSNGEADVFLRDRVAGITERVSVASGETQLAGGAWWGSFAVSTDGRYVALNLFILGLPPEDASSDAVLGVYRRDRSNDTTLPVSVNAIGQIDDAFDPVMTPSGRFIAYSSYSSNMVPNHIEDSTDVLLRDMG